MTGSNPNRQPSGTSIGGQYAPSSSQEVGDEDLDLDSGLGSTEGRPLPEWASLVNDAGLPCRNRTIEERYDEDTHSYHSVLSKLGDNDIVIDDVVMDRDKAFSAGLDKDANIGSRSEISTVKDLLDGKRNERSESIVESYARVHRDENGEDIPEPLKERLDRPFFEANRERLLSKHTAAKSAAWETNLTSFSGVEFGTRIPGMNTRLMTMGRGKPDVPRAKSYLESSYRGRCRSLNVLPSRKFLKRVSDMETDGDMRRFREDIRTGKLI